MSGEDVPSSPVETVASVAGTDTTAAFKLLGNETRLAILLALWEAFDPHEGTGAIPFSALRTRVGTSDSGQFNYHLGRLEDQFVTRTDDGYVLRPLGLSLVQTIVAGAVRETTLPRTELDLPCHRCGESTAITYEEGWLYHVCTSCEGEITDPQMPTGTLFAEPFPAAALSNRTPEEVFAAGVFRLLQVTTTKVGGLCPHCSSRIESRLTTCEDHDPSSGGRCSACGNVAAVRVRWICPVCKYWGGASPGAAVMGYPEVVAFYHEHGVEVGPRVNDFAHAVAVLERLRAHDQELVSTDPLRILVTVRHGTDELRLTLDGELAVVGTDRDRDAPGD